MYSAMKRATKLEERNVKLLMNAWQFGAKYKFTIYYNELDAVNAILGPWQSFACCCLNIDTSYTARYERLFATGYFKSGQKNSRTRSQVVVSLLILLCFSQVIQTAPLLVQFACQLKAIGSSWYLFLVFLISASIPKLTVSISGLQRLAFIASIVVEKFPHKASQFFAYQPIICEASQKLKSLAWYLYDIALRKLAAKNPALSWGERYLQLWLDKFTGLVRSICFVCGGTDHLSELCLLSSSRFGGNQPRLSSQRAFCRNFNGGIPSAKNPCAFTHRCIYADCGGRHGAYEHNDPSATGTDDTSCRRKHK